MRRRPPRMAAVRLLALVLALAGALAVFASASADARHAKAPRATPKSPMLGVNISDADGDVPAAAAADINAAASLHATIVRTEVPWSVLQPTGPGSYETKALTSLDGLIADASAKKIRVILLVDSSPCWETTAPAALLAGCTAKNSPANGYPPKSTADYAAFVAFLAARYGTSLAAIEIWNEPDHVNEHYFAGPEKARHYAELLRAAYPAIKKAGPTVSVIAGSLVGSNGVFLDALYAQGIKGYYDGLAVHYYGLTLASLRAIRKVQLANGDKTPLWLDEFGWSSCYPHALEAEQPCVTESIQGTNLRDAVRSISHASYVAAAVTYRLRDSADGHFGVLTAAGAQKPSFAGLASAFASPFGPVSKPKLKLRKHSGHVIASGSGPVGDIMELEASGKAGLHYVATFVLDRFNKYKLTLPGAIGTHSVHARVYQLWAGKHSAATASI
jgi:Cellulase (glycosyl hydrolase family 5)